MKKFENELRIAYLNTQQILNIENLVSFHFISFYIMYFDKNKNNKQQITNNKNVIIIYSILMVLISIILMCNSNNLKQDKTMEKN